MITCGHCKGQHETVDAVRICAQHTGFLAERMASEAQVQLIARLCVERIDGIETVQEASLIPLRHMTYRSASARIDQLLSLPPKGVVRPVTPQARVVTRHSCRRCGTRLMHPESQARGIGPICAEKEVAESLAKRLYAS